MQWSCQHLTTPLSSCLLIDVVGTQLVNEYRRYNGASPSYMISRAGIEFNVASVRVEQTLQYLVVVSDVCMITPYKNTFFV